MRAVEDAASAAGRSGRTCLSIERIAPEGVYHGGFDAGVCFSKRFCLRVNLVIADCTTLVGDDAIPSDIPASRTSFPAGSEAPSAEIPVGGEPVGASPCAAVEGVAGIAY